MPTHTFMDAIPDTCPVPAPSPCRPCAPCRCLNHLGLLLLRLGTGALLLTHGFPKLLMLVEGKGGEWLDPLGIGPVFSLALCVLAEFLCSLAIMAGFLTRLASLTLVINFAVVLYVSSQQPEGGQTELGMLYLLCFLVLACTGAGRYSLDYLLLRLFRRQ